MSEKIDFTIHVRGGGKKLALIYDSGQGSDDLVLNLGAESMVVSINELDNAIASARALMKNGGRELKHGQPAYVLEHGHGDCFKHQPSQQMPPVPVYRPPIPAPEIYDRDDK